MVAPPSTSRGPTTTGRPAWHQPRPHSGRPRGRRHGPASWGATPMGTVHHQRNGSTPQPSFSTLPGTPNSSHPTARQPSCPRCVGRPRPRAPRHCAQNWGGDGTCHQTTPQYRTPLRPYRGQTSSSPTTRVATTTTSRPHMSAPPSPYTPSPPTLASSHHNTTHVRHGSIHYTSPGPRAKGPPTTRPLPLTATSTQPADGPRHTTKATCSHALALDPAPSPRPLTKTT